MQNPIQIGGNMKGFLTNIVNLLKYMINLLSKWNKYKKQKQINQAKVELKKALAEGRMTDAAYWKQKITQLTAILLIVLIIGCTSQPKPQIVIIGERINKVQPNTTIIVPPLMPPAKQWYLVDDTGLYQWLDIDLSKPKKE